jgi:hypothetical protein
VQRNTKNQDANLLKREYNFNLTRKFGNFLVLKIVSLPTTLEPSEPIDFEC